MWVDVVFVQDWDDVPDAPEWGDRSAMATYLAQWDYGAETDRHHVDLVPPWGRCDVTSEHGIYTLATNEHLRCATLSRRPVTDAWRPKVSESP